MRTVPSRQSTLAQQPEGRPGASDDDDDDDDDNDDDDDDDGEASPGGFRLTRRPQKAAPPQFLFSTTPPTSFLNPQVFLLNGSFFNYKVKVFLGESRSS